MRSIKSFLKQRLPRASEIAKKIPENSCFSIEVIKKGLNMARGKVSLGALMEYKIEACLAKVSTVVECQKKLEEFVKKSAVE